MLKIMGKKIFTIYADFFCLSKPVVCVLMTLPHGTMGWSIIMAFPGHTHLHCFFCLSTMHG